MVRRRAWTAGSAVASTGSFKCQEVVGVFCSRHQDEGFLISGDEHDVLRTLDFNRREHLQNAERKTPKPASVLSVPIRGAIERGGQGRFPQISLAMHISTRAGRCSV